MEKQPLSISPKRKSEVSTSGSRTFAIGCKGVPLATTNHKNNSDMPETTKDSTVKCKCTSCKCQSERDRKVDQAPTTNNKPTNHNKLQWLKGEGPQTD